MSMIKMTRQNKLTEARFFSKKPQIQLWVETVIHYSTISRIECGYMEPTQDQKKKLAKALGVEQDWLFPKESKWMKAQNKRNKVIRVIGEPTLVLDMNKLLAKYTINAFQGI